MPKIKFTTKNSEREGQTHFFEFGAGRHDGKTYWKEGNLFVEEGVCAADAEFFAHLTLAGITDPYDNFNIPYAKATAMIKELARNGYIGIALHLDELNKEGKGIYFLGV